MLKKISIVMTLLLTGMQAQAQAPATETYSMNQLSSGYNQQARFEYSENDVKAFIYSWFAGFDHQKVAGYFLNRIAEPVDMQYPGTSLRSKADFLNWYQNVQNNIPWNSHVLDSIKVTGNQKDGWKVNYVVNWKARDIKGQQYDVLVDQKLMIIRVGDQLKIARLRSQVVEDKK